MTSLGAYVLGVKNLGLASSGLRVAVGRMLEYVGVGLVFLMANVGLGALAILITRSATGGFLSVYALNDVALVIISLLQGLAFQFWRRGIEPDRS